MLSIRERLKAVLGAHETPGRVAAAWALGITISLSPFLFFHTLLALALAFAFRLNKPDVVLGTLFINPWTHGPYFAAAVWLGSVVTGTHIPWSTVPTPAELFDREFWTAGNGFVRSLLLTWGVGSALITATLGPASFYLLRHLITALRKRASPPHPTG